jgi:chromosome segregation ATPase
MDEAMDGSGRRAWRLKDVERLMDRLEADNFNRALRINFLEEQLLAHERRLAPGARDLVEEAQQLREAVEMRDAELAEAYGRLAALHEVVERQRAAMDEQPDKVAMDEQRDKAAMEAHSAIEAREDEIKGVRRELTACLDQKAQLFSDVQATKERERALNETVETLQRQAHERDNEVRTRLESEQGERKRLEDALNEQTAKAAALRSEADNWRAKYVEVGSEAVSLRAAVTSCTKALHKRTDEVKHLKIALAKAKGDQRKSVARDEAIRILLEQLKETQRLIEATKARVSKMDSSTRSSGRRIASKSVFTTLDAIQRDICEIERGLKA